MPRSPSPAVSTPVAKQRAGNGHNGITARSRRSAAARAAVPLMTLCSAGPRRGGRWRRSSISRSANPSGRTPTRCLA